MILFVDGMPDDNLVRFSVDGNGRQSLFLRGTTNALPFLGISKDQVLVYTLYGSGFKQPDLTLPVKPKLIFSQISDPDTSLGALERCVELVKAVGAPVINHPAMVLRTARHEVMDALQGIDGLRVPRTIRCEPSSPEDVFDMARGAGLDAPFIVRVAGRHGGRQMLRVGGEGDYPRLHVFPFDGRPFYISEYLEFADRDGVYHKHRIAVIGDRAIARHALAGPEWSVHADTRNLAFSASLPAEHERVARIEHEFLPGLAGLVAIIRSRLGLDYFGIDCNIAEDGMVTLFEANTAMNMFQNTERSLEPVIERIRTATRGLIASRSGMSLD
jgi:hypothetical protein